jgi:hypothetical protein
MPKYRAFIRGDNFVLEIESEAASYGFYTTRFVEADDPEGAEELAVGLIRGDPKLRKGSGTANLTHR